MSESCFGILLAGGRALRMGGGDKALRRIGGATILGRVIATMAPQCAGLVLNANGDPARFAAYGLPVIADDVAGFKGPLAGILAGLDWVAANRPDLAFAVSAPTDTPFLPSDLVARLKAARVKAGADIACARSGGGVHPVIALWPVAIRADLRHALVDEDLRKVDRFTQRCRLAYADWAAEPFDPFFNANEPADLAAAETIAAEREKYSSTLDT
ncbi:MAG: molybdenum cofactor guanylyltransferase MobA [Methylocella sp.]